MKCQEMSGGQDQYKYLPALLFKAVTEKKQS
jgi:hypothetical protein